MSIFATKNCEECGKVFSYLTKQGGKFCSRSCAASYGNKLRNPGTSKSRARAKARAIWIEFYKKKPKCELCGSRKADVHHRNKDMLDNAIENLQALCRSCHITLHNHDRFLVRVGGFDPPAPSSQS